MSTIYSSSKYSTFKNTSMCKIPNGLTVKKCVMQVLPKLSQIFVWSKFLLWLHFKIIKFSREIKKTISYNNPFSWKISKFFVPRCSLLPPLFYTQNTNICIHIGWKLFLHVRPMWCPWKTQKLTFVWQNSCFDLSFSTKDTRHYYNPLKFFEISWIPSFFYPKCLFFQ